MIIYIPIKKHSQRVPRKNFRDFHGKPLWEHTVDKLTDYRVVVDTDSEKIIEACESKEHVLTYVRPDHLRGDQVSVVDLMKSFKDIRNIDDDEIITQVHVTSPFLKIHHLESAKDKMVSGGYDSCFSADVVQDRFWRMDGSILTPVNHNPMKLEQTQDLVKFYRENSYFYIFRAGLLNSKQRIGYNPFVYGIEYPYNIDIDTEDDWELALSIKNESN